VATETLTPACPSRPLPVRRIKASRGLVPIDLGELWAYRALLYLFMWRDVKTRYRQTYLSGFWAIFRPLSSMVLFSVVFGTFVGVKTGTGFPYPLFVYPGVAAWGYFASAVAGATSSLASNGHLINKAYFPRLYAPLATVTAPLIDLALSLLVLFGLFAWYHDAPSWHIVFLPVVVLVALLIALGIGLWLSGLTVRYRDVAFGVPFITQIWMYATPIIYPVTLVPGRYRWLTDLNPLTAVVDGFRWSMLGTAFPSAAATASSLVVTVVLVGTGVFAFRRTERTIVDLM
jgi:lipopolysaccharide transport system permease protein